MLMHVGCFRESVASLEQKLESLGQEKDRLELINERRLLQVGYNVCRTRYSMYKVTTCQKS